MNTLKYAKKLEAVGFSREQAENCFNEGEFKVQSELSKFAVSGVVLGVAFGFNLPRLFAEMGRLLISGKSPTAETLSVGIGFALMTVLAVIFWRRWGRLEEVLKERSSI
jgi:hypothetical protein